MADPTFDKKRLRRLLVKIEVPDCRCYREWVKLLLDGQPVRALGSPCEHVLAATQHGLSLKQWTAFLLDCHGREYADRPLAARAKRMLTREARITEMMSRRKAGRSLYHPDDVREQEHLAVMVKPDGTEVIIVDKEERKPWHKKR
jgi:hypothetical protein